MLQGMRLLTLTTLLGLCHGEDHFSDDATLVQASYHVKAHVSDDTSSAHVDCHHGSGILWCVDDALKRIVAETQKNRMMSNMFLANIREVSTRRPLGLYSTQSELPSDLKDIHQIRLYNLRQYAELSCNNIYFMSNLTKRLTIFMVTPLNVPDQGIGNTIEGKLKVAFRFYDSVADACRTRHLIALQTPLGHYTSRLMSSKLRAGLKDFDEKAADHLVRAVEKFTQGSYDKVFDGVDFEAGDQASNPKLLEIGNLQDSIKARTDYAIKQISEELNLMASAFEAIPSMQADGSPKRIITQGGRHRSALYEGDDEIPVYEGDDTPGM